jgi:hypothetical protein
MKDGNFIGSPLVLLVIYLLFFCIIYFLIYIFGYNFIPVNDYVINIISSAIIISFTILALNKKDTKTKTTAFFSILLPIISILFFTVKDIATNTKNINIFIIHCLIIYTSSLLIFFSQRHKKWIKIGLGIFYSFLLILILFIFFLLAMFHDFAKNTVVKSENSPNSLYIAEIIDNDQGALGGNTLVKITRLNKNLNILLGKIEKNPIIVYSGEWGEFNKMSIMWETDEILYINEKKYEIKNNN